MAAKDVHVVVKGRQWAVMREGGTTPLATHDAKADAICEALQIAEADGVPVLVFNLGGQLESKVLPK